MHELYFSVTVSFILSQKTLEQFVFLLSFCWVKSEMNVSLNIIQLHLIVQNYDSFSVARKVYLMGFKTHLKSHFCFLVFNPAQDSPLF